MELHDVDRAPTLLGNLRMTLLRWLLGDLSDVLTTVEVRPEMFGRWFFAGLQRLLRRSPHWESAQGEFLAVEVSEANRCPFCIGVHSSVTAGLLGEAPDPDAVDDPVLRQAATFARKITLRPDEITPGDLAALQEQGLDDAAIEEVAYIAAFFSTINRVANALDFEPLQGRALQRTSLAIRWLGYYPV